MNTDSSSDTSEHRSNTPGCIPVVGIFIICFAVFKSCNSGTVIVLPATETSVSDVKIIYGDLNLKGFTSIGKNTIKVGFNNFHIKIKELKDGNRTVQDTSGTEVTVPPGTTISVSENGTFQIISLGKPTQDSTPHPRIKIE